MLKNTKNHNLIKILNSRGHITDLHFDWLVRCVQTGGETQVRWIVIIINISDTCRMLVKVTRFDRTI